MPVTVAGPKNNPWVTVDTTIPKDWDTQSISMRADDIYAVRLVCSTGKPALGDHGIEFILRQNGSVYQGRQWMKYSNAADAKTDYEALMACLKEIP